MALQIAGNSTSTATIDDGKIEELRMSLRGPLLTPGDPSYEEARVIYNGAFDRRPALIISCRSTGDVIEAVNLARASDLLVAVRGGGHSVAAYSTNDGGLVIDLSDMNGVYLDRKTGSVRAGGGATWGDTDAETQAFGLAVPGGVVTTTGIAGLTLSGGIGWLRNKYGLSCDSLISAEVVLASGDVVTASAEEHEDLYWALRGGGGNFGVVTSFEFQAHPVGPMVFAALPVYAQADAAAIMRRWRDLLPSLPDEVTTATVLWTGPVDPHLPPEVHGKDICITAAVYAGPSEEGERVLQPLRELGTPIFDMSGVLPFRGVQSAFDPFFPSTATVCSYWKSTWLNEMSDAAIDVIAEAAMDRSSSYSLVNVPFFSGAATRVGARETAFGERPSFMVSLDANWLDKSDDGAAHKGWARSTWDKLQPHSTGKVYLKFMGQEEQGAEVEAITHSAFGANYERLVDVKTKYDPTNLFRLNQNIKPRS
jgi:FAD/FMN-containing dehydrogenase